jgi:hypothetical protein
VKRLSLATLSLLLMAAALAGCKKDSPTAAPTTAASSASAAASPSAAPNPSGSTDPSASPGADLIEFTVDGAGPYQLGATLTALQAEAGLDEVKTGGATCPENTTARGKGAWKDVQLQFRKDGTLYLAINRSAQIPTPSGAWLGSTLTELKTIYAKVPGQELKQGTRTAYLVTTTSGRGVLFDLGTGAKVVTMIAGDAAYLKSSYTGGTDFC